MTYTDAISEKSLADYGFRWLRGLRLFSGFLPPDSSR